MMEFDKIYRNPRGLVLRSLNFCDNKKFNQNIAQSADLEEYVQKMPKLFETEQVVLKNGAFENP